ncbi:alpha/beta fold hydrolase [Legionella sp. 39-23]|uniref:PHA/PHB synthase family protein n=1 Tax=Legionella sp. 39-23 TaxID=1895902 RepID=UPI001ACFCF9A|nr:alpha/beta fold hydrolase [Legionella sp. 39-23]MBN9227343.1 polyhydroxyalkanoic acid synthase [Legionella steelei]
MKEPRNKQEQNNNQLNDTEASQTFGLDKPLHAWLSHFSGWLSPSTFLSSYYDWLTHLTLSPDKRLELMNNNSTNNLQLLFYLLNICRNQEGEPCVTLRESDHRFQNDLWNQFPFALYSQLFLMTEQAWDKATTNIRGVSKHHQNLMNFITRQILDIFAPSNFPVTNPEVIEATTNESGMNFVNGFNNWIEDVSRIINKQPPVGSEEFKVGKNVAITPGKVVYRNHLIELIQYKPTTTKVYAEPILIVPACIMKYYILDLSPNNSMVKYLVDHGHTVFTISWRNPDSKDRNLSMEDYINLGVLDAIETINHIVPKQKIHSVGYCLGGTMLMLAATLLAKRKLDQLKTITLFAAQIDFKDAGELMLFIDESQIAYLEDIMSEKGYLDGSQMAGTFSMLQSVDLIWSKNVLDYQLGKRRPVNDLMAWDYDTTRLPYTMHSEYLRKLFLNNDLVEGHYSIDGMALSLEDIDCPVFAVSALRDHVAPWKSVYKIHLFTDTDITFVLTNGGHNSGVVNEPGHPGRSYQLMTHKKGEKYISPELWQETASHNDGSWWPAWQDWLASHSGNKVLPPSLGNSKKGYKVICDAPGTYVFQK